MDFFRTTMRVLSGLLMVYYFLVITSFILSWIRSTSEGMVKFRTMIHRFTDPYMKHFRNFSWLRLGMFDFSPILGLVLLGFTLFITQNLAAGYFLTWYDLAFWIIRAVFGFITSLMLILALVMLFRLVTLYTMKSSKPDWVDRLDRFLFPIVSRFLGYFTNRTISYPIALGILGVVLIAFRVLALMGLEELLAFLKVKLDALGNMR